jgi:hypothetical protein
MTSRSILALTVVLVLAPLSAAQVRGGFRGQAHSGARGFGYHRSHSAISRGYYLADTPYFYDDYPFQPAVAEPVPPQVTMMPPLADAPPQAKPAPLLIELQGDRYVRYGGIAQSGDAASPARDVSPRLAPASLAPAVLVYQDGRREEVADYAIVGRVIYAHRTHDEQVEYGLNKILVSALDVPTTVKANRERGVSFVLPAGPNQVVTRP